MRQFLYKTLGVLLLLLLANSILPVIGLYRLHRDYPAIPRNVVKLIRDKTGAPSDILVIGCSNLQHNIDMRSIQQAVPGTDFIYFSGSQSSTFITCMADHGYFDKYKHIILYAPYQMMERNNFVTFTPIHYQGFASYQYAQSIIRHNPLAFFFNWNKYCDSVALLRGHVPDSLLVYNIEQSEIERDAYTDSINRPGTTFSHCSEPFIHDMHVIKIPRFAEEDIEFIHSIPSRTQDISVIYIPIPNISENAYGLRREKQFFSTFPLALNKAELMDSTYFYDQWYHLNKCGKDIETARLTAILKKYRETLQAGKK